MHEAPLLAEKEAGWLKEGMCLAVEIAVRDEETGLALVGETVYLSKDGPEMLTGL